LAEQAHVKVIADRLYMPVLFRAEHVARSTNLKVAQRNAESRAELRIVADSRKPLCGDFRKHTAAAIGEIGIRAPARPADPPAQLMELCKSELVGIFYDKRIGIRNIDTGFDNGGTDED